MFCMKNWWRMILDFWGEAYQLSKEKWGFYVYFPMNLKYFDTYKIFNKNKILVNFYLSLSRADNSA